LDDLGAGNGSGVGDRGADHDGEVAPGDRDVDPHLHLRDLEAGVGQAEPERVAHLLAERVVGGSR